MQNCPAGEALPDVHFLAGAMREVFANVSQNVASDVPLRDVVWLGLNRREAPAESGQSGTTSSLERVSILNDQSAIDQVFQSDAEAYLMKPIAAADILEALMSAEAGEFVIVRIKVSADDDAPTRAEVINLTRRQREILGLLREGHSNKDIARKLSLSPFTVRNHISVLMRLLRVNSRFELATRAASFVR